MQLRLGYPLTGDKRETTIAVVIAVAIIIQTTQNAQALHRANGLTDEQLKIGLATNPDVKAVKAALNALNPVGENLITACGGGVSDILKDGSEQGTFIGKSAENMMTMCDHNTLWMKGMCQTHFDMFSSGISTDDDSTDCQVSVNINDLKPLVNATATGPGGINDYSNWTITFDKDSPQKIKPGINDLSSKLSCVNPSNVTKFYSINVTGTP